MDDESTESTLCPDFTQEEFLNSTKPFEWVYRFHSTPFQEERATGSAAIKAKAVGVIGFKGMYQKYIKSLNSIASPDAENVTNFAEQPIELDTGEWQSNESGVYKFGSQGTIEIACPHPIMPVERLKNIDTGELKVKLAFRRGTKNRKAWQEITTDFDTVSNSKNITSLSRIGISVTSGKRAQNLVDYIADVLDKNYDLIPEYKSVSRMGWNEEGFSPYVDEVVFDGNPGFEKIFQSIKEHGKYELWLKEALAVRKYSVAAKIVLASSFASVLIGPCGLLPFFVHLWGMDSGTGKTVAQMVAASVWANPTAGGDYFKTFKSTSVGFEVIAGFLNSLPVVIDELQLAKDNRGKVIFNVYELASGSGKLRSNKTLGLASSLTWSNCFITSGESPLTSEGDGAGAINRVIEVECRADAKVIRDGHKTAGALKENYGFAGRIFVDRLMENSELDKAKERYEQNYTDCMKNDTTEKQAMAAAVIATADQLATEWIFKDASGLTINDMSEFLKSKEAVSASQRGYEYMCDWVTQNANKLRGGSENSDCYGKIAGILGRDDPDAAEKGWVYIIRSVWNRACEDGKFSPRALLSHLRTRKLIQTRGKAMTKNKRINGVCTECVVMKLPSEAAGELIDQGDFEELPL